MRQSGWRLAIKRSVDMFGAASGLLVLAPAIALSALAVRCSMGSPVLFKQQRPGRDGKPFVLFKFRTMLNTVDADGRPLSDGARLTKTGHALRTLSLDELPQLWNVLRGEMSLVGPRPLLMQYLARYTPRQARRNEVLPGITGWAQVHGRNALTHEQRFELDVWYVENWSLRLDAQVLWLTLSTLLRRSGVAAPQHATMPEFMGSSGELRQHSVTIEASVANG
jgi:lipopolysaccharide/colanic/teichoic acid biosynthesis glycosyltransferase